MQKARIKLTSPDFTQLTEICRQILDVAEKTGVKHSGAIPLPTKKLVIPTRKAPSGGGTESYEKWQLRIHKRIIDIDYLIDVVFKRQQPLDVKRLRESGMVFNVGTTSRDTGAVTYFSNKDTVDFFDMLRASKAMPVAYGKSVIINGAWL